MKGENMKKIKAWYFSGIDKKLRYGDGRTIKVGSVKPLDALNYAPGPVVWRVELAGDMDIGYDKIAATECKYLWGYDATDVLRLFARKCALDVVHLWHAPEIVVRYLKTGDESIRASAFASAFASARASARASAWEEQNKRLYRMIMDGRKKAI
jgi:hypothetical protein